MHQALGGIFAQVAVSSLCAIMIFFSLTSYFRTKKAMHEMRENMYCAKIPTFTVQLCIYVNLVSVSVSEWYCNYSVSSKLITRIPNYSQQGVTAILGAHRVGASFLQGSLVFWSSALDRILLVTCISLK